MAAYKVPDDYPTIQEAVDAASLSIEQENTIDISATFGYYPHIEIGGAFNEDRQLIIRPDPEVEGLTRATIANRSLNHPIVKIASDGNFPGYITLQDLDIVRDVTNTEDLIQIFDGYKITIERCRIGSIWPSTVMAEKCNLRIKDSLELVVRNSIFFAHTLGTFDYGIRIELYNNLMGIYSVLLYNNVVADYKKYGIYAQTGMADESLLLLRNNVVVNHHTEFMVGNEESESQAFWSNIHDTTEVVTSHNAAFVGAEDVEQKFVDDAKNISGEKNAEGEENADFLRRTRAQIEHSFVAYRWNREEGNPNSDFFRLVNGGPLHSEIADAGINVYEGRLPHERDIPVTDDIEKDTRPGGIPLHTDRGADQISENDNFLTLDSLSLTPSTIPGCKVCTGIIRLNMSAPKKGAKIKLTTTNKAASVPKIVRVPAGATSKIFRITTVPVKKTTSGKVKAIYGEISKSRSLTILPIGIRLLRLKPGTIVGGNSVTATIFLECNAAPGNIKVSLQSDNPLATVPHSLTISEGLISGVFSIKTRRVLVPTYVTITASANGVSKRATFKIKPDLLHREKTQ